MGEIRPKRCEGRELTKDQLVEGDGGVMYTGASLTSGYGMHYRENFVRTAL